MSVLLLLEPDFDCFGLSSSGTAVGTFVVGTFVAVGTVVAVGSVPDALQMC